MALTGGARLEPYQSAAKMGAGGMGELYRARDTTLDRDVAVKRGRSMTHSAPRCLTVAVCALALAPEVSGQEPTRLLRQPTISAAHIAFAHANDIWIVGRDGGAARRVTTFQGQETDPHLSPDGSMLAFSAQYEGNTDVYVVPIEGQGIARRGSTRETGPGLGRT